MRLINSCRKRPVNLLFRAEGVEATRACLFVLPFSRCFSLSSSDVFHHLERPYSYVRNVAPDMILGHCTIHRYVLAMKTQVALPSHAYCDMCFRAAKILNHRERNCLILRKTEDISSDCWYKSEICDIFYDQHFVLRDIRARRNSHALWCVEILPLRRKRKSQKLPKLIYQNFIKNWLQIFGTKCLGHGANDKK